MTVVDGLNTSARERFRAEIMSDIEELSKANPGGIFDGNASDNYVFNGVMLIRDFNLDYDELADHICDGSSDLGVDSWWYDDYSNTLYLIQNKLYSESSGALKPGYVRDKLHHPYDVLARGEYDKCPELQRVFSEHVGDDDFQVCHRFNITNTSGCNEAVMAEVRSFNEKYASQNRYAEVFDIDDLFDRYYGEPYVRRHRMTHTMKLASGKNAGDYVLRSITHGTGAGKVTVSGIIVCASVVELYNLCENARMADYNLFEDNVREYLGVRNGVNKAIKATLTDSDRRKLFFLLNNGITITCMNASIAQRGLSVVMQSPQVVNGCQTLSTIYEVLSKCPDDATREREFKNVLVQVSIFGMDGELSAKKAVIDDIVNCRNSQTSIQKNAFDVLRGPARRIQLAMDNYGIVIGVKASDCNKVRSGMGPLKLEDYRKRFIESGLAGRWGLVDDKKPNQLICKDTELLVTYEKLCQIVCMTDLGRFNPSSKSGLMNPENERSRKIIEILQKDLLMATIADLICLYMKVQSFKSTYAGVHNHTGWFPHPAYTLTGVARIECDGDLNRLSEIVKCADDAERLMEVYARTCDKVFQRYRTRSSPGDDTYTKFSKSRDFDEVEFREIHDDQVEFVNEKYKRIALTASVSSGRFCSKCGAEVTDGAKFCSACGSPIA